MKSKYTFNEIEEFLDKTSKLKISNVYIQDLLTSGKSIGSIKVDDTTYNLLAPATYDHTEITGLADNYLKLSGGTLQNLLGNMCPLYLLGNDTYVALGLSIGKNQPQAYLAYDGSELRYAKPDTSWNTLLHAGNYSNYALPLSGGSVTGNITIDGKLFVTAEIVSKQHYLFARDNDNADWVVTTKGWTKEYALLHAGNYENIVGEKFLKLTGGTITADNAWALDIKRNSDSASFICFTNTSGTLGYLGISTDYTPRYMDAAGASYKLLHEGNYASVLDNAYLKRSGGTITGDLNITAASQSPLEVKNTAQEWVGLGFAGKNNSGYAFITYNKNEDGSEGWGVTNDGWSKVSELLHSDNYYKYAPKLDGTGATGRWSIGLGAEELTDLNDARHGFLFTTTANYGTTDGNKPHKSHAAGLTWAIAGNSNYRAQLASASDDGNLFFRMMSYGTWNDWKALAFTDGSNASGTWGINISGGADSFNPHYASPNNASVNRFFSGGFQVAGTPSTNYATGLTLRNADLGWDFQLSFDSNAMLYTRRRTSSDWQDWKTVAFTDSVVAGANKLVTTSGTEVVLAENGGVVFPHTTSSLIDGLDSVGVHIKRDMAANTLASGGLAITNAENKGTIFFGGSGGLLVYNYVNDAYSGVFRINNHGNVTIGASDLAGTIYKLYVNGSTKIAGTIYDVNNIYPNSAGERYIGTSTNPFKYMYAEWYGAGTGQALSFGANNAVHMLINSHGNVTIGSRDLASTDFKFMVNGDILATSHIRTSELRIGFNQADLDWVRNQLYYTKIGYAAEGKDEGYQNLAMTFSTMYNSSAQGTEVERMRISSNGNVGIGTVNPSEKLHVNGSGIFGASTETKIRLKNGNIGIAGDTYQRIIGGYSNDYSSVLGGLNIYVASNALQLLWLGTNSEKWFSADARYNTLEADWRLYAKAGLTVSTGQSITFVDANGNNHILSGDDTAGGLKIDDKIITVN